MSTAPRYPLRATYRVQIGETFDLSSARAILPHLAALGISHLYLSPIFEARSGSTHGYDVTDPTRVRGAIGGADTFSALAAACHERGLGILLDIVPNHMAASEENAWFRDVLEFGAASPFAQHFDFSWRADPGDPRITLPVLGRHPDAAAAAGEFEVVFDVLGFGLAYSGRRFPVSPAQYGAILGRLRPTDEDALESEALRDSARALFRRFDDLDPDDERPARDELLRFAQRSTAFHALCEARARGHTAADLLERQHYRLAFWKDIDTQLAYRRFFDVSDLIGVRVEVERVFRDTHARIVEWLADGSIAGLRVDHVDGLLDPTGYLETLRHACDAAAPERPVPILVEKILAHDESLPALWPVDGTTGYEFLNALNALFVDEAGLDVITRAYRADTGEAATFGDIVYDRKRLVLEQLFAGEWRVLCRELDALLEPDHDAPRETARLHLALREITACLRVYRTYLQADGPLDSEDRRRIAEAAAEARRRGAADGADIDRVARLLLLAEPPEPGIGASAARTFVRRWQQLTGPVMAKGLEDTALYSYHPLASVNDVGGEADHAVRDSLAFHDVLAGRAAHMPDTMNATSTHDTKRSEDVRARLNVLSEVPGEWLERWQRWRRQNAAVREDAGAPTVNEEYLLYQSMIGAWPVSDQARGDFVGRLQQYMQKAMREAKTTTSWLAPTDDHERAVATFIARVLDSTRNAEFIAEVDAFVARIAPAGALNSLAQVAIKAWAPGTPDFYQGTEGWAFDLVDPDNRRPVDFPALEEARQAVLAHVAAPRPDTVRSWLAHWHDGRAKMLVTATALHERRAHPELFTAGAYHPLDFDGPGAAHLFGFAREYHGRWAALIVPRFCATAADLEARVAATRVRLPPNAPAGWTELLTGLDVRPATALPWPLALLRGHAG